MAITYQVVKITGSGVTSVTSGSITTSGAPAIAISSTADVTINTPTDSKSNSYGTAKADILQSTRLAVWAKDSAATGSGHTFTITYGGTTYPTAFVVVANGADAAAYDAGSLNSGGSSSGNPYSRPTLGQTQALNGVLTFIGTDAGTISSFTNSNAGFAITEEIDTGQYWCGAVGTQNVNTTAAVPSSWTVAPGASNAATVTFALKEASGGTAYDLTVDPASYTLTAAAETVTATRALTISPASYAITAAAETLTVTRALTIDPASYSLTNSAATLSVGRVVNDAAASYALTASPQTLTVARALSVDPEAYALTAAEVTLEVVTANPELSVDPVSYVLSLPTVALEYGSAAVERTPGGSGGGKTKARKKTYNYDYSSPKPESVEPVKVEQKPAKKARKSVPADVAEMLQLLESSQDVTAQVLAEQKVVRAAEVQMLTDEQEMLAVIACCL